MNRLKIIFAGSGEFGIPTLRALRAEQEIVQVVTQPDRPAGRGREVTPTPIAAEAQSISLPLLRTDDINKENLSPADLMVVIAFGQKVSPRQVNHSRLSSINLHASLLPRHRGAAPINWTILSGDQRAGNSVIRLAERMDAGAILGQSELSIGPLETAGELHDRLAMAGAPLMLRVIQQLADGTAAEIPQDESLATLAPKLNRQSASLKFDEPAEKLSHQIRGLYPWPGCRVQLCDAEGSKLDSMRLVRSRPATDDGPRWQPGEITSAGTVQCGDGTLDILEVHPDGRTPMSKADYRRGHRWQAGLRLAPT